MEVGVENYWRKAKKSMYVHLERECARERSVRLKLKVLRSHIDPCILDSVKSISYILFCTGNS